MLKKLVAVMIIVSCVSAVSAEGAVKGQTSFSLGGGASLPMGDFKDSSGAETGYLAGAGFSYWLSPQTSIGLELNYHSFGTDLADTSRSVIQVSAFGKYLLVYKSTAPYVKYDVGIYSVKRTRESSNSDFGVAGGLGVQFSGSGKIGGFAEAMYHNIFTDSSSTQFIDLKAGVVIQLGGGGGY